MTPADQYFYLLLFSIHKVYVRNALGTSYPSSLNVSELHFLSPFSNEEP